MSGLAWAAGLILAAAPGREAPSSAPRELPGFSWDAPEEGCPSEAEVRRRLEQRVAAADPEARAAEVAAVARVRRSEGGAFELRLWTADRGLLRERRLSDGECGVLADAAVLLAVLARYPAVEADDPRVAAAAAGATEPAEPSRPPPVTAQGSPPSSSTRSEGRRSRPGAGVAAALGVAAGALPGVGPALRVAGEAAFALRPRWALRLQFPVTYEVERRGRFADRPDEGADLHLVAVGAVVCPVGRLRRVHFPVCAGLEAGAIVGRGVGVAKPRTDAVGWVAIPLGLGLDVPLGRHVAAGVSVEGVFPVLRTVFVVEGLGDVFRPAPAAVRALAAIGGRW